MPKNRLADLSRLSDLIDVPIFIVEVEDGEVLRFVKLNSFHEQTTGMKSAAIAGKRPEDILPSRMAENLTAKYLTCVRTRKPFRYEEVLDLPKGELWWQTTLSPILFDDGGVIGILGVAIDITDRKLREIADATLVTDLREVNEKTTTYASMVAHDVRGPLRKIKVISEMALAPEGLQRDSDGWVSIKAEQLELLSLLTGIADKALEHVDTMLSYARSMNPNDEPAWEQIDLGLLIADIVTLLDADGTFEITYPRGKVLSEKLVLQLALRNLIGNAIRHGRSPCAISVSKSEDNPTLLEFRVADSGDGFPEPNPLQSDASSAAGSVTSGFGLAGVRKIVELRGGALWLDQRNPAQGAPVGAAVMFSTPGAMIEV